MYDQKHAEKETSQINSQNHKNDSIVIKKNIII